jgi:hypothetical protein
VKDLFFPESVMVAHTRHRSVSFFVI